MRFLSNLKDVTNLADPTDPTEQPGPETSTTAALLDAFATDGSTTATGTVTTTATTAATAAPIRATAGALMAGTNQSVSLSSLFNLGAAASNPTYLILNVLDRDEYTAGYKTTSMGSLSDAGKTATFSAFSGDGYGIGIVFTYQAATGQYTNSTYGSLSQAIFRTGTDLGDTAEISLVGTSNAGLAATYANNAFVLATNPTYFTTEGSVTIVTNACASSTPCAATPGPIAGAAMSFVGDAWNDNGCWVLASDIAAKAGTSLPVSSSLVGVAGSGNGEWIVAYNGPVASNANWQQSLLPGEMVSFVTASGGGHITTVVSGSGANAMLVDNITYVNANGSIANSAKDGSSADILVAAPHAAAQEFTGVAAKNVVVYELDTPVVTARSGVTIGVTGTMNLACDFSVANPVASQSITQYQVYDTNTGDNLTLSGAVQASAHSAATALTITSLSNLGYLANSWFGTDSVELRAFNGTYWGDWTALTVNVTSPITVAEAEVETTGGSYTVDDSVNDISAAADALNAVITKGMVSHLNVTIGTQISLTETQFLNDQGLLALLPSNVGVAVSGATVAQAAALQANAQVRSFTVADSIGNVMSQIATLDKDSKLASFSASGTNGGGTLNLSGMAAGGTVSFTGNHASVAAGLASPSLSFLTTPDSVTLGNAPVTVQATLTAAGGIDTISNFQFGVDELVLNLGGAAVSTLHISNTTVAGQHAISIYGSDTTHGIILLGEPASITANSILATHTSFAKGCAQIS